MSNNNFISKITKNWYKIYLLLSAFSVVFIYGISVGNYQIFPYKIIQNAKLAAEDLLANNNYKHYAKIRPEKFIFPARHDGNGVTINLHGKTFEGYTLITSMWEETNGFKLLDMDGTEIHKWLVSYNDLWPYNSDNNALTDWDVDVHSSVIYPNGDLVFNFNGQGLVKIDKNSKVIWKLKDDYHHSISKDENGNIWVPGRESLKNIKNNPDSKYPLLQLPLYEDFICKISPDGKLLKRISLLDIFYNSGMESLLFSDGSWQLEKVGNDITHLNDIDVLSSKLADQYTQFRTGDVMVSMRHLNLVIIIDGETDLIKWYNTGPYIRQHDPDFTSEGDILVFDNRTDDSNGEILGGSRILRIDPLSRNMKVAYQGDLENKFYTNIAGKQNLLPNGNILIVEFGAGRAFEVTENGEIVWTFINRYDDDEVYSVSDAQRISKNYLTFLR